MEFTFENCRFYCFVELANNITAIEIHRKLIAAFPMESISYSVVKKWCREFRSGQRTSCEDKPRSGRPRTSRTDENVTKVWTMLDDNPRHSIRSISTALGISYDTVSTILHDDLHMTKVCSVFIPRILNDQQKQQRVQSAHCILKELERLGSDAMRKYCIEDETWINFNATLPKQENKTWLVRGAQRHAIPRPQLTKEKALVLICFTLNKKFSVKALPYGQKIDSSVYIDFLQSTGERWRKLRSDPVRLCDLSFQHDNARPHASQQTADFIARRNIRTVYQSPYSPDFNLLDRWINAHVKAQFKHVVFASAEEIEESTLQVLRAIPEESFVHHLEKLKTHLNSVILQNGSYIV